MSCSDRLTPILGSSCADVVQCSPVVQCTSCALPRRSQKAADGLLHGPASWPCSNPAAAVWLGRGRAQEVHSTMYNKTSTPRTFFLFFCGQNAGFVLYVRVGCVGVRGGKGPWGQPAGPPPHGARYQKMSGVDETGRRPCLPSFRQGGTYAAPGMGGALPSEIFFRGDLNICSSWRQRWLRPPRP